MSNEGESSVSANSGAHEQLDTVAIAEVTASITKAAWVRKMRLNSVTGSSQYEYSVSGVVDVIPEF